MMYKYLRWIDKGGYEHGYELLNYSQVNTLIKHTPQDEEVHVTTQDYDQDGNVIGCPLYFDIDSPNLYDSYKETWGLWSDIGGELGVDSQVYFSGSKGFHIKVPLYIKHPRCHEVAKIIAEKMFGSYDYDRQVYRSLAMLRAAGTVNQKSGKYKVEVNNTMSLDFVLSWASEPRDYLFPSRPYQTTEQWEKIVARAIELLPDYSKIEQKKDGEFEDMTPCLKQLWTMPTPPEGYRHKLIHLMARHCFQSGLTEDEATDKFAAHHFFGYYTVREYTKVVVCVYRSGKARIGCKSGSDADLLRQYCDTLCPFNETSIKTFIRSEECGKDLKQPGR